MAWTPLAVSRARKRKKFNGLAASFLAAITQLLVATAGAQRAQENAVTSAADAFGTAVGNQTIGLYSPGNARGFSPTDASNIRIEGLYFDEQSPIDAFLFSGTDMRVGITAQSYAFPSPSGIADLKLRIPAEDDGASAVITRGPLSQFSTELDTRHGIGKSLKIGLTLAGAEDFDYGSARTSNRRAISLIARGEPQAGTEVIPFFGYIRSSDSRLIPTVFSDRTHPLPIFDALRLPSQSWTSFRWDQITAGVISRASTSGPWAWQAGVFLSTEEDKQNSLDLFLGLQPDGTAQHITDFSPKRNSTSYSGDLRLTRAWSSDLHRHELTIALRGRDARRSHGGDSVVDFGEISIYRSVTVPQVSPVLSDEDRDAVRQIGIGINYIEQWKNRASLGLGLLTTHYRREINSASGAVTSSHLTTTLPTVSFTANLSKAITVYASYTRGLEDSMIAPSSAQNRGEPAPATPTWQVDGGIRVSFDPSLRLLAGAFEVQKSYFGLDESGRYRGLGEISTRGLESSATWTGLQGLTVVAGAYWLRPEVKRRVPELGGGGTVPVGPVPRSINVNVDYAPSVWNGWGMTAQWASISSRVQTGDNLYMLPPLSTLNLTIRYLFKRSNRPCSVRIEADNVTNARGLYVSTAYTAGSQLRRTYMLTFAADL